MPSTCDTLVKGHTARTCTPRYGHNHRLSHTLHAQTQLQGLQNLNFLKILELAFFKINGIQRYNYVPKIHCEH